jgi:type VI protein secretion system component Hcp
MASATLLLKLQGPSGQIKGESQVDGYEGHIVLESMSWTIEIKDDKPTPSGISFSKFADRASVPMLQLLQSCKAAPSAEILIEEDSVDSELEVKFRLTQVRLMTYSLTGKVDEKSGSMEERWTARADKLRLDYRSYAGKVSIPFEIDFDPRAEAKSPEQANEDEVLEMALKKVQPNRLDALIKRIQQADAKRKLEHKPAGDEKEARITTV